MALDPDLSDRMQAVRPAVGPEIRRRMTDTTFRHDAFVALQLLALQIVVAMRAGEFSVR